MKRVSESAKEWLTKIAKDVVDDARMRILDRSGAIDTRDVQIYEYERYGHDCDKCGKPWVKVDFSNELGSVSYYKPQCDCFPRCFYCGRVMIREVEEHLPDCVHCFHTKATGHWDLQSCGKKVQVKSSKRYGHGDTDGKFAPCDGFMRLSNSKGDYVCDKCGRTTRRVKDEDTRD
jgi:ribosomal protein L37AE/L43A